MNDVTALMGRLKANVTYLQFDHPLTEARANPPLAPCAAPTPDAPGIVAADPAMEPTVVSVGMRLTLGRYAPSTEPRALADIFARLQAAAR